MPRKSSMAWASPFRSRKKRSDPEPVQSNWATGPPVHLTSAEKTSPLSRISPAEHQHVDDDALQWAAVVRDPDVRDTNVGMSRPTSLRDVSGEVREKLHRRVRGDPRELDASESQGLADVNGFGYDDRNDGSLESTGENNGSGDKEVNAAAAAAFFATSNFLHPRKKKSAINAMELLREGDAGRNRRGDNGRRSRKGDGDQKEEKEEDDAMLQRSDAHANLFAPDTDDENEDSISEVLQYSSRTWRFGRRDNDDDSVNGAGAAVAAAVAAGVGGIGGLAGHEEDGLTRSEVDSCSMLGTESVVRSDIDSMIPSEGESLVGQHLIENDEDEDSDHAGMYAGEDFPGGVAIRGGSRLVGAHGDDADDLHHPGHHPADIISTDLGGAPVVVGGQDGSPGLPGVVRGSGFYGTPRGTRRRSQRRDGDGDAGGVQEEGWRRRSKDNHEDEEYVGDDQHHYRRHPLRRSSTLQSTNAVGSPSPPGVAYSSPAAAAAAAMMPSKMASPGALADARGRRFENVGRRGIASSGSRLEDPPVESKEGSTGRDRRPTSMVCNSGSGSTGEFPARVGSAVEVLWERIRVLEQRRGSDAGDSEARAAQLEKENTDLKEKLKTIQNEQEPQRAKAVEVEKETSVLTKRLVALQREAVEARAKGSEKTKALEDRVTIMQNKQKLDAARSRELSQENASLKNRLTNLTGKVDEGKTDTLQKENASLKERIKDLQGKVDEDKTASLGKENASLKERLTAFQENEDVRARTEQELREQNASLKDSLAALQGEEQKNHARSEELYEENASLFERLAVLESQLKELGEANNLQDENAFLHKRVASLKNEFHAKVKTSADEVAMLNRRISDLRKSHSENMAAAADEFASLNERVNGSYKESRKLAASHSAQLEAKDQEIEKLQHSLAAAAATAAEKPSSDRREDVREPPAHIYEERLREKDAEISRLLLLHHKKINNIKDDHTDIGGNLHNDNNLEHDNDHDNENDPSRKNSAHSVGGVTDEDGGCSSWSASTASSSLSHMDPANAGPSVDRLYTVGGECSIGGSNSSGVVVGVSVKKSAAEVARERRFSNRDDAHRGCLVLTCGTIGGGSKGDATNANKQESRRGLKVIQRPSISTNTSTSTSGLRNSKEASPTSTSAVAAAAARLAKAQGVDIIASSCTGARGVGDGVGGFGNASYVFAGAQVHQTAAFWDVLSRTLSSAGEGSSGPSSGVASPRGEEVVGAEEEAERENATSAGENAEEKLSVRGTSAAPAVESAKEKTPVRENSLSSSAHDKGKVACALDRFSDTALACGWGEHGVGDMEKENPPTLPSASPAPSAPSAAPAAGSTAPVSASASTPCCSAAEKLRDMERSVREREELAAQAIRAAVRAEELARVAGDNALAALDAAEEKMSAAEKITTTALWQAEGDFSAAEEGIRQREESARRAEAAARAMEAKAKEQRDLCMELMASAQANAARTEKELESARLAVAKARGAHAPLEPQEAQAQQIKSSRQRESRSWSGQRSHVQEVAAQRESRSWSGQRPRVQEAAAQQHQVSWVKASAEQSSPVLVPPSPLFRGDVSRQRGVIVGGVGGDRAINTPATRTTAAAVAKYVAAINAAAETSGNPVSL